MDLYRLLQVSPILCYLILPIIGLVISLNKDNSLKELYNPSKYDLEIP